MSEPELPWYMISFWGGPTLDLREYGRRAHDWFQGLAEWEPALTGWRHTANSLKQSLARPVDTTVEGLIAYLTKTFEREHRRNPIQTWLTFHAWAPIPELGKGQGASSQLSMNVLPDGYHSNVCSLGLDSEGESGRRMFQTSKWIELCTLAARCWEPDYGFVTDHDYTEKYYENRGPKKRWTGWIVYLARRLGRVPPLPAPARIVPIEDRGSVIVVTEEPFRADNPEHVERAERIFELLDRAGLMDTP